MRRRLSRKNAGVHGDTGERAFGRSGPFLRGCCAAAKTRGHILVCAQNARGAPLCTENTNIHVSATRLHTKSSAKGRSVQQHLERVNVRGAACSPPPSMLAPLQLPSSCVSL